MVHMMYTDPESFEVYLGAELAPDQGARKNCH